MKINNSKKQRGAVVPLVTIVLPLMLFSAGWALDFGHVFVDKSRLQNALDATALSAAIAINRDLNRDTSAATGKGLETFNQFKAGLGNSELAGLNANSLRFEYSKTLSPFTPGTNPPAFVRVTSAGMMAVSPVLLRVFSQFNNDIAVPAVATAGPVGQNCSLVPLVLCPSDGEPVGCNANGCNGIPYETKVTLKGGSGSQGSGGCDHSSDQSGNFGLLRFNGFAGGSDIRSLLAGNVNVCVNTATWENGNKVGPVSQAIDDRFDDDLVRTVYSNIVPGVKGYPQYLAETAAQLAKTPVPAGTAYNRIMPVPVVDDCSKSSVNIVAASCFLLTERATHTGTENAIVGELLRSCPGPGEFDPRKPVLNGPYKVVLYKSSGSSDS